MDIKPEDLLNDVLHAPDKKVTLNPNPVKALNFSHFNSSNKHLFEKKIAGFFQYRGFETAYNTSATIDFIAVDKLDAERNMIIVGECQTFTFDTKHLEKLCVASQRIQNFLKEKCHNGLLESVYVIDFNSEDLPSNFKDLAIEYHIIIIDKKDLEEIQQCKTPKEVYGVLIHSQRY